MSLRTGIVPIRLRTHSLTFLAIHPASKEGDSLRSYSFFLEGDISNPSGASPFQAMVVLLYRYSTCDVLGGTA